MELRTSPERNGSDNSFILKSNCFPISKLCGDWYTTIHKYIHSYIFRTDVIERFTLLILTILIFDKYSVNI